MIEAHLFWISVWTIILVYIASNRTVTIPHKKES